MSFSNLKIIRKLSFAFATLLITFLGLILLVLQSLSNIETATDWNTHTYVVLDKADKLMSSMVNQETGLRGFLITGDNNFLGPFRDGIEQFKTVYGDLRQLTADNPTQQDRLARIEGLAEKWRTQVAGTEIGLMRNAASRDQVRALEASGAGKASMDAIRSTVADFQGAERGLLSVRSATMASAGNFARWSMMAGGAAAALLAISMAWLLSRTIAAPVASMTDAMQRLARGDNQIEVPAAGRKDEVGEMATAVEAFRQAALEKIRLEQEAAAARRDAETQRQHNETARAVAAQQLGEVVDGIGQGLDQLTQGELTFRLVEAFAGEYEKLRTDFNSAMEKLSETMVVVSTNTSAIRFGTDEISAAADDLSKRTEQQAASLEETASALDEITATVRKTAEGANHARKFVGTAKADAEQSGEVVRQAVEAMDGIEKSSGQINQIIGVIDEIAFQTNLLALNAGVEAARAGEAGRGFAVVASEVRALAQRSAEAAKEIKALISTSNNQVERGVDLVAETGRALERIVSQITEINSIVVEISASAQEQSVGLDQVNTAINHMDQVTQQNAAMVEESTAASRALARETEELSELIGKFHVGNVPAQHTHERRSSRPSKLVSKTKGFAPRSATTLKVVGRGGAAPKVEAQSGETWQEF